jgi:hypothetical protein
LFGRTDSQARRANSQPNVVGDKMLLPQVILERQEIEEDKEDIEDESIKNDAVVQEERFTERLRALGYIE